MPPLHRPASSRPQSRSAGDNPGENSSRIKVVVRVRPPIREDIPPDDDFVDCTRFDSQRQDWSAPQGSSALTEVLRLPPGSITIVRPPYEDRQFHFDRVLDQHANQQLCYDVVARDLVEDFLKGFNATVMAYGQVCRPAVRARGRRTGTGKTHTVFGSSSFWEPTESRKPVRAPMDDVESFWGIEDPGIIPRAVRHMFDRLEAHRHEIEFRVTASFLQIYMESILDLLNPTQVNLSIREDPKMGIYVDHLTPLVCRCASDVMEVIRDGAQNRAMSNTLMNKTSSRSHVVLLLTLEQRELTAHQQQQLLALQQQQAADGSPAAPPQPPPGTLGGEGSEPSHARVKRGVLTIVDLAGSERVSKTGSDGYRLEEVALPPLPLPFPLPFEFSMRVAEVRPAKKINKSLSALGNVVSALTSPSSSYIPFRDSKLTRLLTDSLGGNSKTCLCANIGPGLMNFDETHSTLLFATRAMAVKCHAVINEVADFKALSKTLHYKLIHAEQEKMELITKNLGLEHELAALRDELETLKGQVDGLGKGAAGASPQQGGSDEAEWARREKELMDKFSVVVHHLQMEIARQEFLFARQRAELEAQIAARGEGVLDQLAGALLSVVSKDLPQPHLIFRNFGCGISEEFVVCVVPVVLESLPVSVSRSLLKMVKICMLTFSLTGNTAHVAQVIASKLEPTHQVTHVNLVHCLQGKDVEIRQMHDSLAACDVIGLGSLVWAALPAPKMGDMIRKCDTASFQGKPAFIFSTDGGHAGDTRNVMAEWLAEKGAIPVAQFGCYAPSNWSPGVPAKPNVDRWGTEDIEKAAHFGEELLALLARYQSGGRSALVPITFPRGKAAKEAAQSRSMTNLAGQIAIDRTRCVGCRVCVSRCPYGALDIEDGAIHPRWSSAKCMSCTLCVNLCPKEAISLPRFRTNDRSKYVFKPTEIVQGPSQRAPGNAISRLLRISSIYFKATLVAILVAVLVVFVLLGWVSVRGVSKLVRRHI
ncbi:putative Kinesin-II 95 kDa subunit [Paratrimastix pyriformis]|uniref:Kinesin-like protein n=1 Tax=Paratrimastix pyriformis TaxID=342808 RepID=A0ABQ8UFJ9_9EUKA|nr:putative Kinesin-II 95 kDa subunit [Paratrimastix pyriformis]